MRVDGQETYANFLTCPWAEVGVLRHAQGYVQPYLVVMYVGFDVVVSLRLCSEVVPGLFIHLHHRPFYA